MIKKTLVLFAGIIILLSCSLFKNGGNPITIAKEHGASGTSDYLIIYKNTAKLDFEISRPDIKDTNIILCIPAAFTRLDDYKIDGLYICKGKIGNKDRINYTLGEGIIIVNGDCNIFPTKYGKLINDSLIAEVVNEKGSFFQQVRMVDNDGQAKFNADDMTWRRGIAKFKDGKTAIVESLSPISFGTFASDVAALGATALIYTDMGAWDEGWYREPKSGHIISMGNSRTQTARQSNWVVLRR